MKYTPDCTRMNNNTPTAPLHGVDFSGSQEVDGRNDKIWIASWLPGQRFIQLNSGGDYPGFDRKMLSTKIIDGSGTWVIDFPFGPPNTVAEAAGWNTWKAYIAWCGSHPDPVVLRDQLRKDCQIAGLPWSIKRDIDCKLGTTWFPFFEQLYRQTITGGRDVLSPLIHAGRERVRVLPFHDHALANNELSVVVEGFPGATLTNYDLPNKGYKRRDYSAQETRRFIVESLIKIGIPISNMDASRAIHDTEGDAVDALVLLCAARNASLRSTDWRNKVGKYSGIEGWFFD